MCRFPATHVHLLTTEIRTSFFLIGFYTMSLVCLVLIMRFGILRAINPPTRTVRGLFVLSCGVAGIAGGGVAIFFWKATRYFIGAWGGLAFALWIQCFREGGLIHPIGFRWIMYIGVSFTSFPPRVTQLKEILGCAVVGFVLCTIPKFHYYTILVSTAFVGSTAFMLGVDCYTTANLKEVCFRMHIPDNYSASIHQFYMWNLGFNTLFQRYLDNGIQFPISQTMQIELGLLGAISLMGVAVQLRILKILQRKLREIKEEQRRQDEVAEARAADRFASLDREREQWEHQHPSLLKHDRNDSQMSNTPLMKDEEMGSPMGLDEKRGSTFTLASGPRARAQSGVSSMMLSTPGLDGRQSPGALPALDLGIDLEADVPKNYMAEETEPKGRLRSTSITLSVAQELEDLKKKQELLSEIQNIRKSIDILKSETPAPSSSGESRRPSFSSRRTLSHDFASYPLAGPSHLRPARASDPRARVQSMELSQLRPSPSPIGRPTSVPLQETNWDEYVRDRKLLQPPSGVSQPIQTSPVPLASPTPRAAVSPAVTEALLQRQRRESSLSFGRMTPAAIDQQPSGSYHHVSSSRERISDDLTIALRPQPHKKSDSQGSYAPGVILPPRNRRSPSPQQKPDPARVMTFEELAERHREKLRQLQQPLTEAEKEQAEIQAAKSRWERSNQLEKQAVTKRQAEQAAVASREAKSKSHARTNSTPMNDEARGQRHSRSLSADVLGAVPTARGSSRRMSALKVEDWQKHRLEEPELKPRRESAARRGSTGVPFPEPARGRSSKEGRRSAGLTRDPPS